jgi:hypothetical protein
MESDDLVDICVHFLTLMFVLWLCERMFFGKKTKISNYSEIRGNGGDISVFSQMKKKMFFSMYF